MWVFPVLAGCLVFFVACDEKTGGPGGEDDRPVTMTEGSFKLQWFLKSGANDNGFEPDNGRYKHSLNAPVNRIKCNFGSELILARIKNAPLIITYTLNAKTPDVVQMATNKNGKHLSAPVLTTFTSAGSNELLHPDSNAKITKVTFANVALVSGDAGANHCTASATSDGFSCDLTNATQKEVKLTVCRKGPDDCAGNVPAPAPPGQ